MFKLVLNKYHVMSSRTVGQQTFYSTLLSNIQRSSEKRSLVLYIDVRGTHWTDFLRSYKKQSSETLPR